MGYGALDVVQTPAIIATAQPLLAKMITVAKLIGKFDSVDAAHKKVQNKAQFTPNHRPTELIVIGASTGGPKAIAEILGQLPASLSAAIVVVQHIDEQFTAGLADWLKGQSALPVALAAEGDRPQLGRVLLAQAHGHLVMKRDRTLTYATHASINSLYCPSVDALFESVAQHWHPPGRAVLLTGMGRDGAVGLGKLRAAGWQTIAESEQSCVVYGMPRAAVEIGAAERILAAGAIASALTWAR